MEHTNKYAIDEESRKKILSLLEQTQVYEVWDKLINDWEAKAGRLIGSPKPSEDRTFRRVFEMPKVTESQILTKICKHQYRNPIFLAREWQKGLSEGKYDSRTDLSRKMGVSRARVTQVINLLKLPEDIIEKVYSMGDPLPKPVVTERSLRRILKNTCQS